MIISGMQLARTHKVAKVQNWLARHPRYHVHFTPTSGSWLYVVERLFAEITERCVRRGSHTAIRQLSVTVGYLGVRGEHLTRTRDINLFPEVAVAGTFAGGNPVTYYRQAPRHNKSGSPELRVRTHQ